MRRGGRKSLPLVPILVLDEVISEGVEVGGLYWSPSRKEVQIGEHFYSLGRGLVVVLDSGGPFAVSTLAHEYRHLEQVAEGGDWLPASPPATPSRESIRRYFHSCWREMDALAFEVRMYPEDVNSQWLEWSLAA